MSKVTIIAKDCCIVMAFVCEIAMNLIRHGQSYLIYPAAFHKDPNPFVCPPSTFGLPYENVTMKTPDNVKISAFLMLQRAEDGGASSEYAKSRPTIYMFHGNGANLDSQLPIARVFYRTHKCNVFMLSYRGFGTCEGKPSERGLKLDSQTGLEHILAHPILSNSKLVLYGQSLGGAVAIDLASRNPEKVHALIVENTFLSIPKMVPATLPILGPFRFLCFQKWDSEKSIALIPRTTPILLLSGLEDEVVPASHMERLFEIATQTSETDDPEGVPRSLRQIVKFPEGSHNNTVEQRGYWRSVATFMSGAVTQKAV